MKKSVFDLTTSEWAAAASAAGQAAAQKAAQRGRAVRGVKDASIENAVHDAVLPAAFVGLVDRPTRSRRNKAA
jgi:hypothetical protein